MSMQIQEGRIALVIKTFRTISRLSVRGVAKAYDILESILCNQIKSRISKAEERNAQYNLIPTEEETFVRYIFDLDSQRFLPRFDDVQSMVDLFYETYNVKLVGKQWLYTFVKHYLKFKTRFSYTYNFQ